MLTDCHPEVNRLVHLARSYLSAYDESSFSSYLKTHWTSSQLIKLLDSPDADLVKVAAAALGILYETSAVPQLTAALAHEDSVVSNIAEFSLWSIWYHEKGPEIAAKLYQIHHLPYDQAVALLDEWEELYPDWAELFNQRAILHFKNNRYVSAMDDCKEALAINENHFGALAGLGHVYAKLGLYAQAISSYQQALKIHPRMPGIRQCLLNIRSLLQKSPSV